jgi:hypothetical protein
MTQSINSTNQQPYGTVTKIGKTKDGRVLYECVSGQERARLSVPYENCDKFEKAYGDVMKSAPSVAKRVNSQSPEEFKKQEKIAKWVIGGCTAIGGLIPLTMAKGKDWQQILWTLAGTIAGFATGVFAGTRIATTSDERKMLNATKTIQSLNVRYEGSSV